MKIKRNKKSYKWFLCGLILVVVLTITLIKGSRAGYKSTATIELTSGIVKYSSYDFNIVSMYIDGVEQDKSTILPSTIANYTINENETYCYKEIKSNRDNNAKISINVLGELVIKGISKGSKCILSLNTKTEEAKTISELLNSHYTARSIRKEGTFNQIIENTTYGTIYEAEDDDGITYYFAGNPLDNWVEFGGYYWRIIRINGDGSIRIIYQGRTEDEGGNKLEPQATGEETVIGNSPFNSSNDDNAYVGYMYGTPNSSTYEETHANINDSTIKQALDNWFNNSNLKQEQYFNKIDLNAGFCGDRTISGTGFGKNNTSYSNIRIMKNPRYKCVQNNDLYTFKGDDSYSAANKGNKVLNNPVGLITADEVNFAGLITSGKEVNNNYLNTKQLYWTMSPFATIHNGNAYMYMVGSLGYFDGPGWTIGNYGIRPVINIRSDVNFSGNGTISNPYKVI